MERVASVEHHLEVVQFTWEIHGGKSGRPRTEPKGNPDAESPMWKRRVASGTATITDSGNRKSIFYLRAR